MVVEFLQSTQVYHEFPLFICLADEEGSSLAVVHIIYAPHRSLRFPDPLLFQKWSHLVSTRLWLCRRLEENLPTALLS